MPSHISESLFTTYMLWWVCESECVHILWVWVSSMYCVCVSGIRVWVGESVCECVWCVWEWFTCEYVWVCLWACEWRGEFVCVVNVWVYMCVCVGMCECEWVSVGGRVCCEWCVSAYIWEWVGVSVCMCENVSESVCVSLSLSESVSLLCWGPYCRETVIKPSPTWRELPTPLGG